MSKELLKLIENTDPSDRHAMFVLNETVYEWFLKIGYEAEYGLYVSSRDALKAIELDNWRIEEIWYDEDSNISLTYRKSPYTNNDPCVISPFLKTFELSQAHCILRTIKHERGEHE